MFYFVLKTKLMTDTTHTANTLVHIHFYSRFYPLITSNEGNNMLFVYKGGPREQRTGPVSPFNFSIFFNKYYKIYRNVPIPKFKYS